MLTPSSITDFLGQIAQMETAEQIHQVGLIKAHYYAQATPGQAAQIRQAIQKRFGELEAITRREFEESVQLLAQHGLRIDPDEWLTLKRYGERYGLSPDTVTDWIAQGIIPADCTMTLPELRDIRLVKNQTYL